VEDTHPKLVGSLTYSLGGSILVMSSGDSALPAAWISAAEPVSGPRGIFFDGTLPIPIGKNLRFIKLPLAPDAFPHAWQAACGLTR
jgi:hypothetical protein